MNNYGFDNAAYAAFMEAATMFTRINTLNEDL